jgi:hypothetical protein
MKTKNSKRKKESESFVFLFKKKTNRQANY